MRCYLPLLNSHPQWNKPCWSCSSTRKKSAYSSKASLREALKLGREHIKQQVKGIFQKGYSQVMIKVFSFYTEFLVSNWAGPEWVKGNQFGSI
jgi:hypothetical protein